MSNDDIIGGDPLTTGYCQHVSTDNKPGNERCKNDA
jgi:hypothetical protein